MGCETKISEQNGSPERTPKALAHEMGELARDVFMLAELQVQLFVVDMRECGARVLVPGLALLSGAVLGFACFPIALTALALWFIEVFETSYLAGFLMAVVAGVVLSSLLCIIGWFQVRKQLAVMRRSQQELVRNLHWIKKVLERRRTTRKSSSDNSWRTLT